MVSLISALLIFTTVNFLALAVGVFSSSEEYALLVSHLDGWGVAALLVVLALLTLSGWWLCSLEALREYLLSLPLSSFLLGGVLLSDLDDHPLDGDFDLGFLFLSLLLDLWSLDLL